MVCSRKEERKAVTSTCVKLSAMTWEEIYRDRGLRWELIESRTSKDGSRIYSIRVTRKVRAVALRNGNILRLLSLHPDHDSAQ